MPAPVTQIPSNPPRWVHVIGFLFGAAMCAPYSLLPFFLDPFAVSSPNVINGVLFALLGSTANGGLGALAAHWSWRWAMEKPHPFLARYESWLPLRGRWLVLAAAALSTPLRYLGIWLGLATVVVVTILLLLLPFYGGPLAILGMVFSIGHLGAYLKRHRPNRSGFPTLPAWQEEGGEGADKAPLPRTDKEATGEVSGVSFERNA